MKGDVDFDPNKARVKLLPEYCKLCGWALGHAKSDDPSTISGYLGKSDGMDQVFARFAFAYAEQTDRDYDVLVKAAKEKRIAVAVTA